MITSAIALVLTALMIVISISMGLITVAWKLSNKIEGLRTHIADQRTKDREYMADQISKAVVNHKASCRAAQDAGDLISGVHYGR